MSNQPYYIGIMSGTSLDGIDVALCQFDGSQVDLIDHSSTPYKATIKQQLDTLVNSQQTDLAIMCQLDRYLAQQYAQATNELLAKNKLSPEQVSAIGCHGQTLKHDPTQQLAYTLQIGDPNTLASLTQITTVSDFRRKDIALGGQGAPLAPAFHQQIFSHPLHTRVIINIGGIANITLLPKESQSHSIVGFDTGPGNTLMDHFCQRHWKKNFDHLGEIASQGHSDAALIEFILKHEGYFHLESPKSTGTDYFNLEWFDAFLQQSGQTIEPINQLATLNELTAITIAQGIKQLSLPIDEIYCCGGGSHNQTLLNNLTKHTSIKAQTTAQLGLHPDWVEACAFAWFAKNTLEKQPSNLPHITSASKKSILGGIYFP